jgi:serine/threonine-protein kinase RsbW
MKSYTFQLDAATVADLDDMRLFLEQAVLWLGGGEEIAGDMVLAVNEAATNILLHGYQSQPGEVVIEVMRESDEMVVRLLDRAPLFDPTTVPPPDISLPLEERPLGGLGVHMMRQLCDELIYLIRSGGGNELRFLKYGVLVSAD